MLRDILNNLKKLIVTERLYDKTNPSIITCNEMVERALNVKSLHASQTIEFLRKQMANGNEEHLYSVSSTSKIVRQACRNHKIKETYIVTGI